MNPLGAIVIFFTDLKEEAQKRIIEVELETILEVDEVKVESITIEDGVFGYDPDPEKQELIQYIHAETSEGKWLMTWDCEEHEFQTDMEDKE